MSDAVFSPVSFCVFVSVPEKRKEDGAVLLIEHNKADTKQSEAITQRQQQQQQSNKNVLFLPGIKSFSVSRVCEQKV